MTDTNDLIAQLAQDTKPAKKPLHPGLLMLLLLGVLFVYSIGAQVYLGLRPDLANRLTDPWFEAETVALWFLIITSAVASITAMAPDAYQKPIRLQLPYVVFAALIVILGYQMIFIQDMSKLVTEVTNTAGMECSICIALISLIPSALIFALIRQGATVHPLMAGSYAVLTATGVGCFALRLAEPNDSLMHLTQWHYLPTLLFAMIGAALGKWLLKW